MPHANTSKRGRRVNEHGMETNARPVPTAAAAATAKATAVPTDDG